MNHIPTDEPGSIPELSKKQIQDYFKLKRIINGADLHQKVGNHWIAHPQTQTAGTQKDLDVKKKCKDYRI